MPRFNSMDEVLAHIRDRLGRFFTNVGGRTFAITGLPPELTGAALARYSRAPTGMQRTLVDEFLDENGEPCAERGSKLMDRVLNQYGDESVGELEGAHVGIEDVSQLAIKTIEDRRIGGSPIEQSTRYVRYDVRDNEGRWRYLRPREVSESGLLVKFERVMDSAFEVYSEGIKLLVEHTKKNYPESKHRIEVTRGKEKVSVGPSEVQGEDEAKAFRISYNFTVRCTALDIGRCVLPASTLTHLGLFGNGRFYTNVITALKSGELDEERVRGAELEHELAKIIPTFIQRNRADPFVAERNRKMRDLARDLFAGISPEANYVSLVPRTDLLDEILASSLFPYTHISLPQILDRLKVLSQDSKLDIFTRYIGERKSRRDRSGRGLEAGYPITFDLVGGFAEYRDLQRHRMLTQQRQLLSPNLGFIMPPEIGEIGLADRVEEVEGKVRDLYSDMKHAGLEVAAQYATLFNHRMRLMMGMNLREFQHLSELRTQPAGHFSYRAMVQEMARQVSEAYPWAESAYGFVDFSDPGNKITRAHEQGRIAGKNLASGVDGERDLV